MDIEELIHIIQHTLLDSSKIFIVIFLFYVVVSFFETKISQKLDKNNKYAPLFAGVVGLIPQCSISVVGADLYLKNHLTTGTLLALFIACSDEALPILLADVQKIPLVIPMILCKFFIAITVGYFVHLLHQKESDEVHQHIENCHHEPTVHIGCCHHEIDNEKTTKINKHLIHPLIHSLKIIVYVLIINFLFGLLLHFIGEEALKIFLNSNQYLAPLFAVLIGIIPNCTSSIIISELYLLGGLGFGATLGGLIVNAGLGSLVLLKSKNKRKKALLILLSLIAIGLIVGYAFSLITLFK